MAHDHTPVDVDPVQVQHSEHSWHVFIQYGKWLVISVIVLLVLMAVFLL